MKTKYKPAAAVAEQHETMKFRGPELGVGKRTTWMRTKTWLLTLLSEMEAKKTRLDGLNAAREKAEASRIRSEKNALLDSGAALQLAGLDTQLSRLATELEEQQKSLDRDMIVAIRQLNLVRATEVRELLLGPLHEQLLERMAAALEPFFSDGWQLQTARGLVDRTKQYRQISFYLNPPPFAASEFEDVKTQIVAFAGELTKIIDGETLIEVSL